MNIAEKIIERMIKIKGGDLVEACPIGIIDIENWEWPQGIGMYGIYKYYEHCGERRYLDYLVSWYDKRIKEGLPERNVNTTAPMLALIYLAMETGREDYLKLCRDWAEWVMNEMPRTEEGGIQHAVSGEENRGQLWIDTLFMTVLFLAKCGVCCKRADYTEEAKRQFLIHIKYLYDKKTRLWFHGWTFEGRHNFAGALWARGNCWYTIAAPELLEMLGTDGAAEEYLKATLAAQAEALSACQCENGAWHTLLDDEGSYEETSAAAGFCYGILKAARLGYIDEKYKRTGEAAARFVLSQTDDGGTVQSVSYGTGMGRDLQHYRDIPICPMTYGQALAALALTEASQTCAL